MPNLGYGTCKCVVGDKSLLPDLLEQFRFFHHPMAVLDQVAQHVKGARREIFLLRTFAHTEVLAVDYNIVEA